MGQSPTDVLDRKVESAIGAIERVLGLGFPVLVAYSAGKDSSVILDLTIEAGRRLMADGGSVPPIRVSHSDTQVENPLVNMLALTSLEEIERQGRAAGLDVECAVNRPFVGSNHWVRIISGRKLPSYIGLNADCTDDYKRTPALRFKARFKAACKDAGKLPPVTILGTRFEESQSRGANMRKRGESAGALVRGDRERFDLERSEFEAWRFADWTQDITFSPIAEWNSEDVFAYLGEAGAEGSGRSFRFRSIRADWRDTLELYGSANGMECVIFENPDLQSRACGGNDKRMGCHQCLKIERDRSMENMLLDRQHEFMRPLNELRNWIASLRGDLSVRRWIGRDFEPLTGAIKVFPNCFSPSLCEQMLRVVLTIDAREQERAREVGRQIATGEIADTADNRRLARPQFQNLTLPMIFAIDWYWGLDQFNRPFAALRAWHDVMVDGQRTEIPAHHAGEVAAAPQARFLMPPPNLRFDLRGKAENLGSRDTDLAAVAFDGQGLQFAEDIVTGATRELPSFRHNDHLEIDEQAVDLFMAFELEHALRINADPQCGPFRAAQMLMRIGVVGYPHGSIKAVNKMMGRALQMAAMGIAGDFGQQDADRFETISAQEHEAEQLRVLQSLGSDVRFLPPGVRARGSAINAALDAIEAHDARGAAGVYDFSCKREIGLQACLNAGIKHFDGFTIAEALKAARKAMSEAGRCISASNRETIKKEAIERGIALVVAMRADGEPRVEPGFGVFLAVGIDGADIEALRRAGRRTNQLNLLSA